MHAVRWTFVTAVLALGLAFASWCAGPASAQVAASDSAVIARSIGFEIRPRVPCAPESLTVIAWNFCSPWCLNIASIEVTGPSSARLLVHAIPPALCDRDSGCAEQQRTFRMAKPIPGSTPYFFTVLVQVPPDSLHPTGEIVFTRRILVTATATCTSPPDSLSGSSVDSVVIASAVPPCAGCPPVVCANQPLPIRISGWMSPGCEQLDGGVHGGAMPLPGGRTAYLASVMIRRVSPICTASFSHFGVNGLLPPAPPGLTTFFRREVLFDETTGEVFVHGPFPQRFVAKDTCGTPPPVAGCVWPYLLPRPLRAADSTDCHLTLLPGTRGYVRFAVRSSDVPLAGVQGVVSPGPGLRLLNLYNSNYRMHMTTHRTDFGGIAFALYADEGAPIPPGADVNALVAEVVADTSLLGGERLWLAGAVTAASDSLAHNVPLCPIETFAPVLATVCIGSPATCDANRDGHIDVADLVGLARCWQHPETCADSLGRPDCNADGAYQFDDIFCCARVALGAGREGTPRRPERLTVSFGAAVYDEPYIRVPIVIRGAGEMNGALLRVRYPADRYEAQTPIWPLGPARSGSYQYPWITNVEPTSEDVVVSLLRSDDVMSDEATASLYFTRRDGATPGGTLTIDSGDLMARDGARLDVDFSTVTGTLPDVMPPWPGPTFDHIELLARPNPSPGATVFTLRLPRSGQVDLSVFDLAGRRVATVWKGTMAAGEREVPWQPTGLRRGLYFAKLSVNGAVAVSRIVLQPQR